MGVESRIPDEDRSARAGTGGELQPDRTAGRILLQRRVPLDASLFEHKKLDPTQVRQVRNWCCGNSNPCASGKERITGCIQAVAEHLQLKLRDVMPLMFPAITGHASSVSVLDAMEILGADLSRYRLRQALELLGGASKKENEWRRSATPFPADRLSSSR